MATVKAAGLDAFRRNLIGQTRPVLWETARAAGNGNGDENGNGGSDGRRRMLWRGLTDNYVRVAASVADHPALDLGGNITPARLTGLRDDGVMTAELA